MMKCAIYARVSRAGKQDLTNQLNILRDVAEQKGYELVGEYTDEMTGVAGRDKRSGFAELMKGANQGLYQMILVYDVSRLGRSLKELVFTLEELQQLDCGLYLHANGICSDTPTGRLMFSMISVFSSWEREMLIERTHAGLERARRAGKTLGRPKGTNPKLAQSIRDCRSAGMGIRATARKLGCGVSTIYSVEKMDAA